MKLIKRCIYFLLLAMAPFLAISDTVYRTVDESGRVTFSDGPATDAVEVEKVELPPAPSAQSIRETEARTEAIRKEAQRAQGERAKKEKNRQSRLRNAQKALEEAEAHLASAKIIQNEDRQSYAGGKRGIRPEYFDRVAEAEESVAQAKKRLNEVRRER